MSDPEKKPQSTDELTNSELEGAQGGMMIPAGTRLENNLKLKIAPTLTETAEAADQNSDQSPLF
jgi:hypothetical protein